MKKLNTLDIAASFVFFILGVFIYSPIGFLHGATLLNTLSFVLMLLLILAGICILKRKKRLFAIASIAIFSFLFLLLCEELRIFVIDEEVIKIVGKIIFISFIGDILVSVIILSLAFSSLFIILKEKFVESSKHNFFSIMVYVLAAERTS